MSLNAGIGRQTDRRKQDPLERSPREIGATSSFPTKPTPVLHFRTNLRLTSSLMNRTKEQAVDDGHRPNLPQEDSRFGGLAGAIQADVVSSVQRHVGDIHAPFVISPEELAHLSNERTRAALADLLAAGVKQQTQDDTNDPEAPTPYTSNQTKLYQEVMQLVEQLHQDGEAETHEHDQSTLAFDKNGDIAANVLTQVLLRSSPENGIDAREVEHRRQIFGSNEIAEKELESFLKLCWEAVQDFVLIMLIVLGITIIILETSTHDGDERCSTCWIEGTAILCSVCIVVLITAGIDYTKQFAFIKLTKSLHDTNTKSVIRDGKQISITDDEIVVGDILSVNSHSLASIPADCVLLGPPSDLKMDESSLTGESKLISKKPGDVILSGTNAVQGSGKMVVIAVGTNSVSGRIKARVYESKDHEDELGGEDVNSPLFVKLDTIAKRIGVAGTVAAVVSFLGSCLIGLAVEGDDPDRIPHYLITAITVLAVAVPEGLPLAVTLALAFSSNKMMQEQNLVKHLDACETMGCATTICTDKTGTLTANKMTVRALYSGLVSYLVDNPSQSLGDYIKTHHGGASAELVDLICRAIAINTMNETVLYYDSKGRMEGSSGNPTEVALLVLVHDLGSNYEQIRNTTRGRSDVGRLGEFLAEGKQYGFSSSRKMMSWAVPKEDGSYRIYTKGAAEVILARCRSYENAQNEAVSFNEDTKDSFSETALVYARRGMRCLALAYRDLPADSDLEATTSQFTNSDGTDAFEAETSMVMLALVGIEDPLRAEVPRAIEKCYAAGIDVRMVTGDNASTAVSIAYQAGIIRDFHFKQGTTERIAANLKPNVLLEGKQFRSKVYVVGEDGKSKEFSQAAFDKIWPHLRVLARSSPDDKLTLAHGLNQSTLFADKELCRKLGREDGIKIFPDRQVVAMTGDGTNDAPALKRADIGFAMGVAGTQIAKDAADIILLDDNFASIVTAAKWGRNVYASIQKFLQFQLTVNISAVVTALVGSFAHQTSPLAAIQLLWVNLLMDSLASLALASEPPVDELLQKPPVNRSESMISKHMLVNMLGQSTYQITVTMTLLFAGPDLFDVQPGHIAEENDEESVHYTLIFNSFVWMVLFNEINCRKLKGEFNVFKGILDNYLFCGILLTTAVLQVLIVQYGSIAFSVVDGGLDSKYWMWSIIFGVGSLPVQQLINILYQWGEGYNMNRNRRRFSRAARWSHLQLNGAIAMPTPDHSHEHAD